MRTKIITVLILVIIASLGALAQHPQEYGERYSAIYDPTPYMYFPIERGEMKLYLVKKGVSSVNIQNYDVKGEKEKAKRFSKKYHFDGRGNLSFVEGFKRGKRTYSSLYTQDEKGRMTSVNGMDKDGKLTFAQFQHREDESRAGSYTKLNKKGDTTFYSTTSRIENFESNDYYYKNGKLKYHWLSEYYPNNQLKRTTLFNGKGKKQYVWDYQCKEEGVEVLKHKDTSTVCKSKTAEANGDTLIVTENINAKGEITRWFSKKNKYGVLYYRKQTKGVDNTPTYEQLTYFRNGIEKAGKKVTYYNKKGKKKSLRQYTYDKNGSITSTNLTTFKKGVVDKKYIVKFAYDERNRPIERVTSNDKDGITFKSILSYDD